MKNTILAVFVSSLSLMATASDKPVIEIKGVSVFSHPQVMAITEKATSFEDAADRLANAYKKAGYIYVDVSFNAKNNTITVVERKSSGQGKYGKYFNSKSALTKNELALRLERMKPELQANNEKTTINFSKTKNDVNVNSVETPLKRSKVGSALIFSNLGQRYSGENVGSAYVYTKPGSGQIIETTISHAFKSQDAEGGQFNAGVLSWKKYSWLGESLIRGSIVDYKTGGEFLDYGLSGRVLTLNLEQAYLVSQHNKAFIGYGINDEKKYFDLISADDHMLNSFVNAGIRGDYDAFSYDATFTRGMRDNYNWNGYELLGVRSTHFNTFNIESEFHHNFNSGDVLSVKTGAQLAIGGNKTPGFAQLYAGGLDRGRAYNTGFTSVENGVFGRIQYISKPNSFGKLQSHFYVGADGLRGETVNDETVNAYSAFVGAKGNFENISFDTGIAKKIGADIQPTTDEYKFYLTISNSFN